MIGLLRFLDEHGEAVEADLQRYYQVDYRDRWRRDARLPLRRIWVLVRHLPPDSAVAGLARSGRPHWPLEAHLLDDLRIALTSTKKTPAKPHPLRPRPTRRRSGLAARIAAARRRHAARGGDR